MTLAPSREKDLDEVLQTTAIFANVGKGVMAAKEDLQVRARVCVCCTTVWFSGTTASVMQHATWCVTNVSGV